MGRRAAARVPGKGRRGHVRQIRRFRCDDPVSYDTRIDMASALHPQTIMCLTYADKPLEPIFGAPMRVKIPTKLGFKQPKFVSSVHVTNQYPGGYWERYGYNWFAGL